jgi:tRNA dimethylallyltransferase
MDIGTAKPSRAERGGVPHHLIDLVDPTESFTVAQFQQAATAVLAAMAERGATPIVVGGTGLYVRAVVDAFTLPGQYPDVRAELELEASTLALWHRLEALDPVAAAKVLPTNRRRVVRALEVSVGAGRPFSSFGPGVDAYPPTRFRQIGLEVDRNELDQRIEARYEAQMEAGFLQEVEALFTRTVSSTAAQALGYAELAAHLRGELSLDAALSGAIRRTRRLARRQQRWFRRDPRITWFDARPPAVVSQVHNWWRNPSGAAVS